MLRILPFVLLLSAYCRAQTIENVHAEAQGPVITITYDLTAADPTDTYNISVTSSASNFKTTLTRVSGDVGKNVTPGPGKKIIWLAQTELGSYQGQLTFEIHGDVVAALAFSPPLSSAKRGKTQQISWRGGSKNQDVKIELLKDGVIASEISTVGNNGSYAWNVPADQKPGSNYAIRLTNGKETVTHGVTIKHKVPTLLKVAPLVVAGGVVAAMSGGDGGTTKDSPTLSSPPEILD